MIPNRVPFRINPLCQPGKFVRLNANQEECCGRFFLLQHIEDLRSPLRIRAIIKRDCHLIRTVAVTAHAVRLGQVLENFVRDQLAVGIYGEIPRAVGRLLFDAENFPLALHVDVGAGRHIAQFVRCTGISRHVPDAPQRAIFAPEAPESERLDPQALGNAHVIERRDRIDKPDVVPQVAFIQIAEMRIHRIVVEIDVLIRVSGRKPRLLHADPCVMLAGRKLPILRFQHPVIAIIGDGADDLVLRNNLARIFQIVQEPVL